VDRALFAAQHARGRLGGCSLPTFGAFRGATTQGQAEFKLWSWMTIAGLVVAVIVWGLILWAVIAYRRRDRTRCRGNSIATYLSRSSTRPYRLIIVAFIFFYTVTTENKIDALAPNPAVTIKGHGFPMGVELQLPELGGQTDRIGGDRPAQASRARRQPDLPEYPQFVLPLGETTRIVLQSADVVHGFYIPAFNFSRYAAAWVSRTPSTSPSAHRRLSGPLARNTAVFTTPRCSSACASSSQVPSRLG